MSGLTRAQFLALLAGGASAVALRPWLSARATESDALDRRPIPSTGEVLPVIGLGTYRTFDIGTNEEERQSRRDVLRLLLDGGGRVIDSSPMYGRAEAVVGALLAELGDPDLPFVATKVWTRGREAGIRQMTESIDKLGKTPLDLMQIHNLVDWRTHIDILRAWKAEGRIRYLGITHSTRSSLDDLADALNAVPEIDFVQCAYSIGVRDAARRLFPVAAERGVAVLVNRPYEQGGLFRRVKSSPLPDWASEIGAESWGQVFLKFILAEPAVTCVIPGTGNPRHLRDNLAAGRGPLPDAAMARRMASFWDAL